MNKRVVGFRLSDCYPTPERREEMYRQYPGLKEFIEQEEKQRLAKEAAEAEAAKQKAAAARAKVVKMPSGPNEPPRRLSDEELWRRQQIIDRVWEANLEAKRELEEMYSQGCHRGRGDSDWGLR
jgi:hypothetical protein